MDSIINVTCSGTSPLVVDHRCQSIRLLYEKFMGQRWGEVDSIDLFIQKYLLSNFYVPDTWNTLMSGHETYSGEEGERDNSPKTNK